MKQKAKSKGLDALERVLGARIPDGITIDIRVTDQRGKAPGTTALAGWIEVANGKLLRNFTKAGGRVHDVPSCW